MVVGIAAATIVVGWAAAERHVPPRAGGVLGAGEASGPTWATASEVEWLRKVGGWNVRVRGGLAISASFVTRGGSPEEGEAVRALKLALASVQSCAADLDTRVGPPPTVRLGNVWRLLHDACSHLRTFGDELSTAVTTKDRRYLQAAGLDAREGSDLLLRSDLLLPPGEAQALPVISGASAASHVDPKFSRIAGALAHHRVEVRCWSRAAWPRLIQEEAAYTLHHIDADAIAFAPLLGTRDNLSPSVCERLEALAYKRSFPTDPVGELAVAQSVVALAHEPQHSRGIAVESQAECYAIQLMRRTAIELGARPDYAASLQQLFWRNYDNELPSYRSPKCRSGAAYDLHPASRTFP
jgi:hypothetical protein